MEIGTEISKKIRAAIKAKLVELGAYVDDELPDYIMVMVANKKNQSQITEDLNLFLGANTTVFTEWLNQLLDKLQTITTSAPAAATPASTPAIKVSDQAQPTVSPTTKVDAKLDDKPVAESKVVSPQKVTNSVPIAAAKIAEKAPEVIEHLKITPDNIADFDAELQVDQPEKETAVKTTRVRFSPPTTRTITVHHSATPAEPPKRKSLESPPAENKYISTSEKRRVPGSTIGAVITHDVYDDDEYDPYNPFVGNVASVIRVSDRKSSIPHSLQANKSLLFKAMNEAHESIKLASHRRSDRDGGVRRSWVSSRFLSSRRPQRPLTSTARKPTRSSQRDVSPGVSPTPIVRPHSRSPTYRSRSPPSQSRSPTYRSRSPPSQSRSPTYRSRSPPSRSQSPPSCLDTPTPPPPPVTVRHSDEDRPRRHEDRREVEVEERADGGGGSRKEESVVVARQAANVSSDSRQVECDDSAMSLDNQLTSSLVATGLGLVSTETNGEATDPTFVVTLDGADTHLPPSSLDLAEDMECDDDTSATEVWNEMSSITTEDDGRLVGKVKPQQMTSASSITADDDSVFMEEGEEEETGSKRLKKCTFWPNCRNGDHCPFHHPSVPCRNFKTCTFGENCLYIHPTCKFNANCTRPNCPFIHSGKQAVVQPVRVPPYESRPRPVKKVGKPSETMCQFFPKCTNMNCAYKHPKPCRFGMACRNRASGCPFAHPKLPSRQQLRWAPSSNQSSLEASAM